MKKIEAMLLRNFKTEAHAYLRMRGFKVPTPSHSKPIYVHLGYDLIYCEGKAYRGAIPEYGEQWFTKDRKPLDVKFKAINITERTLDDMVEVVVHETWHIAHPKSLGYADKDFQNSAYAAIETDLKIGVPLMVKAIASGALLRHKAEHLNRIMDFYKKEGFNPELTVDNHRGAFHLLCEASRLIKQKFSRINLKDKKKLSRFSKSHQARHIARNQAYYFNMSAERIEHSNQAEAKALKLLLERRRPRFIVWYDILAHDRKLAQVFKEALDLDNRKDKLYPRGMRDEPFGKY